jgi:hypothetical protein
MVQFNLLPEVKLEFIRTRRTKRLVMLVAIAIGATTLLVFIFLFIVVNVLQKQHISNLEDDIKKDTTTLKEMPDLGKVLTVQSQLTSLPGLHSQKPVSSRMFDYITQLTPEQATISHLIVDFDNKTIAINGKAQTLEVVNKFVDTIKFTDYKMADDKDQKRAFSDVVLKTFGRDEKEATYEINLTFDAAIFDNAHSVSLVVPKIISTRSQTEKPDVHLFEQQTNTQPAGQ